MRWEHCRLIGRIRQARDDFWKNQWSNNRWCNEHTLTIIWSRKWPVNGLQRIGECESKVDGYPLLCIVLRVRKREVRVFRWMLKTKDGHTSLNSSAAGWVTRVRWDSRSAATQVVNDATMPLVFSCLSYHICRRDADTVFITLDINQLWNMEYHRMLPW